MKNLFRRALAALVVVSTLTFSERATFPSSPESLQAETPSDVSGALLPPRILKPVPAEFSESARTFQGISSLTVSKDGALWLCWYGGEGENTNNFVLAARSDDRGETWSEPIFGVDWSGPVRVYDPNIWSDPNGKLWLFWAQSEDSNNDGRHGVWALTTTEPEKGADAVWTAPRRLANGIMLNKPTVDSHGRWLFPVSHKPNGRKYNIDPKLLGACAYVSTDDGATLYRYGIAKVPDELAGCDEHMIVEKQNGDFWMLTRAPGSISESFSTDGGFTWTPVRRSKLTHTSSRFFIRRLQSGALLLVKHGPLDEDVGRTALTAYLSTDDGATWQGGLVLDERDQVSYPDGDQADDGTIYITYDFQRTDAREICVARFAEEDVLAKKIVSAGGKLKIVANKATGLR